VREQSFENKIPIIYEKIDKVDAMRCVKMDETSIWEA
jgi:hypothetical protein